MLAVLCMSGGIDSATALYQLANECYDVDAVFVDYGQPSAKAEARAIDQIKQHLGHRGTRVSCYKIKMAMPGLPPEGHGHPLAQVGSAVFGAVFAYAASRQPERVVIAASDAATIGDSPEILNLLLQSMQPRNAPGLYWPFRDMPREDVLRVAKRLDVPIGLTWSCQRGGRSHCGQCLACRHRIAGQQARTIRVVHDETFNKMGASHGTE